MPVEGFDAPEQFAVVAAGDEDLGVVAHGGLEQRERTVVEVVRLEKAELVFCQFGAWFGLEFSVGKRLVWCAVGGGGGGVEEGMCVLDLGVVGGGHRDWLGTANWGTVSLILVDVRR